MPRSLVVLFLTVFVGLIGFGIIIPLLPFYAQTFGASPTDHRAAVRVVLGGAVHCGALSGRAVGSLGPPAILIFSLLGTVVSFALLAMAHSITMLFIARIVDGLSGGNITTARAYIADVTPVEDRAKRYGLHRRRVGLGFIFGPALGAVFAHISYTAPIWAAAVVSAIAALLAFLWLPEPERHVVGGRSAALVARARRPDVAAGPALDPGRRSRLLVHVLGLPDDVRAVRPASLRLGRAAHRLRPRHVRGVLA